MKGLYMLLFSAFAITTQAQNKFNLLIGTYTNTCQSNGIYIYEFDASSGEFKFKNSSEVLSVQVIYRFRQIINLYMQ